MDALHDEIYQIESVLLKLQNENLKISKARRTVRDSLQKLACITPNSSLSLAETFKSIAQDCSENTKQEIGLVSIRLLSTEILPSETLNNCRPYIAQLIQKGCPNLTSKVWTDKNSQNHEKLESIKSIHQDACDRLRCLQESFSSLQDLNGRRQMIMKDINHGLTRPYLNAYGFGPVRSSVSSLLKSVERVTQSQGHELQAAVQDLMDDIADNISQYQNKTTFIVQEYMVPFLQQIQNITNALQDTFSEKFACSIIVPNRTYEIEKKYPLHVVNSQIQLFVPLTNKGPGIAKNVLAHCVATKCDIQEEITLGDAKPGLFNLPLNIVVTEPQKKIDIEVEIQWNIVGDASKHTQDLSLTIKGQRTDLDWSELSLRKPYNLEVAYDEDFFGRKDALRRILRRLSPNSMQSCYITGQKRVGKSSLARAVETRIQNNTHPSDYKPFYLECGEIRHSSGESTLQELGRQLEEYLASCLHHRADWTPKEYSSSLIPLNRLLEQLKVQKPDSRFVIILDEFDEINESLYRYGELADTFFLNLRTLSSKRNIAFILVGAEKMPHVMASQGEKLNKFECESLDSFNQETEWADFRALVEMPVKEIIKFHESALRKLFEFTYGHPYFTKMLCTTVYECSVESKDAEISSTEIEKAARRLIATLDSNAFAHYWRDGIYGSDEIEIVSLQRCHLLMAWARAARSGKQMTRESIESYIHSSRLDSGEVLPLLEDFCKRGVFQEYDNGIYSPTVSLFATWLQEGGFTKLVSDSLGDKLAEAKQLREDKAYVQAEEIVSVADKWDSYQGQKITEDKIRAWIEQVESHVEQRSLFKLLQNVRFLSDFEAKEKFVQAHKWIHDKLPIIVKKRRSQRREDVLVSFADEPGKSGAHYAALYANANEIAQANVITISKLENKLSNTNDSEKINGLVIIDDMIGTGTNLVERLSGLSGLFKRTQVGTTVPFSLVVLCSTVEGERKVRKHLADSFLNADLEVCEPLESKHFAFNDTIGFWETENEKNEAKTLLTNLGALVQKRKPLGYGNQGLLLTFSRNCPNNSLPILHGHGKGNNQWKPLFPRMRT